MALTMYMGQPLHGDTPTIAIDLFDKSLKNLAPSYLIHLMNEKLMNGYDQKGGTFDVKDNTITVTFEDGSRQVCTLGSNNTYNVKAYSPDGVLMQEVKTFYDVSTGQVQTQVVTDGSVNGIKSFAEASWDDIAVMLKRHYAGIINLANFWSIGDTKTIKYNAMIAANGIDEIHPSMEQKVTIVGFSHDYLTSGGKAAITLQFVNGIGNAGYIHGSPTNVGGWRDCQRRAWCNNTFFASLPAALQNLIKPVNKQCTSGNGLQSLVVVSDKVFLPSESELKGNNATVGTKTEGDQYPYFMDVGNIRKKQSDPVTGYDNYWTRSPNKSNTKQYAFIEADGDTNSSEANAKYRIVPTFCL